MAHLVSIILSLTTFLMCEAVPVPEPKPFFGSMASGFTGGFGMGGNQRGQTLGQGFSESFRSGSNVPMGASGMLGDSLAGMGGAGPNAVTGDDAFTDPIFRAAQDVIGIAAGTILDAAGNVTGLGPIIQNTGLGKIFGAGLGVVGGGFATVVKGPHDGIKVIGAITGLGGIVGMKGTQAREEERLMNMQRQQMASGRIGYLQNNAASSNSASSSSSSSSSSNSQTTTTTVTTTYYAYGAPHPGFPTPPPGAVVGADGKVLYMAPSK